VWKRLCAGHSRSPRGSSVCASSRVSINALRIPYNWRGHWAGIPAAQLTDDQLLIAAKELGLKAKNRALHLESADPPHVPVIAGLATVDTLSCCDVTLTAMFSWVTHVCLVRNA